MSSRSSSNSRPSDDDTVDKASSHTHYRLRVTAGPSYDTSTHKLVQVNAPQALTFESEQIIISVAVRIKHFTGFPLNSPETSAYFSSPLHKSDQYSISFSFVPKQNIAGSDLLFGNDFDRPIRDRLPPGFNQAFKIVKWWIDPGLEGDVYADQPYLYGHALSSWNHLRICDRVVVDTDNPKTKEGWKMPNAESFHEVTVEEGAEGTGEEVRKSTSVPADAAARKKHFLTPANCDAFTFEAGRLYQSDFGNPYLDFNDFSLKLPGFSLNVIKYIDSKSHELRYTLKNKTTGEVYMVVLFTLLFGKELKEAEREAEGVVKEDTSAKKSTDIDGAEERAPADDDVD